MSGGIIDDLQKATSDGQKNWVVTSALLQTLPEKLAETVIAAAVPHWFDAQILSVLLEIGPEQAQERYASLGKLSFTGPFGTLGRALHDLTRKGILSHLFQDDRERLRRYGSRAHGYFNRFDDPQNRVEAGYQSFLLDRERGLKTFQEQMTGFRREDRVSAADNALRNARELLAIGILGDREGAEIERQDYLLGAALLQRGKQESQADRAREFIDQAVARFDMGRDTDRLRRMDPQGLRDTVEVMQRDFVVQHLEEARAAGDPLRQRQWLVELGNIERQGDDYATALARYNAALALNEDDVKALSERGETYRLMGDFPAALADLDRVIGLDGESAWATAHRGETYRLVGDYPAALADFDRAIGLDDKVAWAIARRGEVHAQMGNCPEALEDLNRAVFLDAENDWYKYTRGIVHLAMDHPDPARNDLAAAIELAEADYEKDPDDWTNTLNLALYHLAAGNVEEARRRYQTALAAPEPQSKLREARTDLEDLQRLFPGHEQAQEILRLVALRLGETDGAS